MITIGFSTREHNSEYITHLKKTCAVGDKNVEVIEIINTGDKSLTECYNKILHEAKNDMVVFVHDDVIIETASWGSKLIKLFKDNPTYGIIGVAGTKFLHESGKWWEKPKKMYGRVKHTLNGKTWLSAYSPDLSNIIEDVVVVDGVLFAVNKNRIKADFDENVKGFHFYDVNFCFRNFLEGVGVGVTTKLKIIHKSIGQIGPEWEANRKLFAEEFKDSLPVSVKRVIRKNEKLKVMIGCLSFKDFTGSELYVYELAKGLIKEGCEVSICSNIGDPLLSMAVKLGIKVYPLSEPPSYKLGDGKWLLKGYNGATEVSKEKMLYKVNNTNFDIIHLNHKPVAEHLIKLFPETPMVYSIHSEILSLEEPVVSPQIKKYITIRPEITEYISTNFNINKEDIELIYNPVDSTRFKVRKAMPKREKKRILFVGTIDYLRKQTINDLIETTRTDNKELWIVGRKNDTYLDSMIDNESHVKYFEPTFAIENYIHECDEVAGILLGRTTIEGWMCGKPAWIYNVDPNGNIINKKLVNVPEDVNKFNASEVVSKIIKIYEESI
jgi:glycosyltransferase involved in cell wall biosynthesis